PRAHHLDADHQRIGENDGPAHLIAELRAGLRIGCNSAGVVVGGAGDEAWAKLANPSASRGDHGGFNEAKAANDAHAADARVYTQPRGIRAAVPTTMSQF